MAPSQSCYVHMHEYPILQLSIFMKPELKLSHEIVSIYIARIYLREYQIDYDYQHVYCLNEVLVGGDC